MIDPKLLRFEEVKLEFGAVQIRGKFTRSCAIRLTKYDVTHSKVNMKAWAKEEIRYRIFASFYGELRPLIDELFHRARSASPVFNSDRVNQLHADILKIISPNE